MITFIYFSLVDMISYAENVKKMLEMFNESGIITAAVVTLWKATFLGRRRQILRGELSGLVNDIVAKTCPVLNHMTFVSSQMLFTFKLNLKRINYCRFMMNWISYLDRTLVRNLEKIGSLLFQKFLEFPINLPIKMFVQYFGATLIYPILVVV